MRHGLLVRAALTLLILLLASASAFSQATEGDDAPLRFGRFEHQGKVHFGVLAAGGVHELDRSFLDRDAKATGRIFKLEEIRLLAPVIPSKVIGIALNYESHGGAKGRELGFFAKLPSAVIGPEDSIVPPLGSSDMHFEGEMVVVIGARAKAVAEKIAADHIFGVTAGNDVTERSFPFQPFDILRAKGFDTSSPLGPWIVPGLAYDRLKLVTRVNGKQVQSASTREMVHGVAKIVAEVSRYITLEPGDLIYTGTPGHTSALKAGDVVEVELEGVGILRNTVAPQ